MLSIIDCCSFIPEKTIDPSKDYSFLGLSNEEGKIYSKFYGLSQIRLAQDEDIVLLMSELARILLEKHCIQPEKIKYLAHARTCTTNHIFGDSIVRNIKQHLLLVQATAFGCSFNKCVSIYDLFNLLEVVPLADDEYAIALAGEIAFTKEMRSIPAISLTSDACSAILISKPNDKHMQLIVQSVNTYGEFAKGIWLDSQELKKFSKKFNEYIIAVIEASLTKADLRLEDIKLILPNNVNLIAWARVAKLLSIPTSKIYLQNIPKIGHCFNADLFLNYECAIKDGLLNKGDYVMSVGVSVGASFASAIFRC
jgi:3-oxoacyl-[acyl-carrier-protein] synthase-3